MKTLIKAHYSEPHVDTTRIMRNIFNQKIEKSPYELLLIPVIAAGILLLIFLYFLLHLNIEFLSTTLSLYYAVGNVFFILGNLLVGILVFIMEHRNLLTVFTCLVVSIEL